MSVRVKHCISEREATSGDLITAPSLISKALCGPRLASAMLSAVITLNSAVYLKHMCVSSHGF